MSGDVLQRAPFKQTKWTAELLRSPHHPTIKRLMVDVEKTVDRILLSPEAAKVPLLDVARNFRERIRSFAQSAISAGADWARSQMPIRLEKQAAFFDWNIDDNIDQIVLAMKETPNQSFRDAIHESINLGGGARQAIRDLEREQQADKARDIARTVYMNLYTKAALREMQRNGYVLARRLEINDHKTCDVCWALNNSTYEISTIVNLPNPLTHDTHPRCRGSFVPVVNSVIALPQLRGKLDYVKDVTDAKTGTMILNAPLEYVQHLSYFARRHAIPFAVEFDANLPVDSRLSGSTLQIHPRTLFDQDPREVILEAWAAQLWPKYEGVFREHYVLLAKMGLVKPSRTVSTVRDFWISEFVAWKQNQLDTPWEILWFRTFVKET